MRRSDSSLESVAEVNFVLMGVEGSGKTALAQQLLKGKFVPVHSPTTLETAIHTCTIDDAIYQLHLCDSSGSETFEEHRVPYIALADGILLVYSITDQYSLYQLPNYVHEVCNSRKRFEKTNPIPLLLIGTGTDCPEDREVSIADAERVAAECIAVLGWKSTKSLRGSGRADLGSPFPNRVSAAQSVLEITCRSHAAVTRAFHTAVRIVQAHRERVLMSTVDTMYQGVDPQSFSLHMLSDIPLLETIVIDDDLSSSQSVVIPAKQANVSTASSVSRLPKQCTSQSLRNSMRDVEGTTVSHKSGGVTQSNSQSSICMGSKSENGRSRLIPVGAPQRISKTKPSSVGCSDKGRDDPEPLDDIVRMEDSSRKSGDIRSIRSGGGNRVPNVLKGKSHRPTIFWKPAAGMKKVDLDSMCKANCFSIEPGQNCVCVVI